MTGYLDDPDSASKALRAGWLHTGDTVRANQDGYLHVVDRAEDVIVPDSMRDESVKAFVILCAGADATAEDLRQWCAQRFAKSKVPSSCSSSTNCRAPRW
ncbi:hypothetical protein ABT324_02695 [Saccharopolyspora sp. NPDC000359]|uniref:hypothetical protein n=1 Tax=Saccharopolyspora sp. NPDC000359 TaxID=3154251 RepID=UPI00332218BA